MPVLPPHAQRTASEFDRELLAARRKHREPLEYLQDSNFVVYRAPAGEGEPKFVCQGSVVTVHNLILFANEHRATRHLPPFQLVPQIH